MNNSLFPHVDPSSIAWTGPPSGVVIVQSLLYASLMTSLLAASFAFLGKQWVNRYIRNRGGSAADKSRDRQSKLDGLEKWHFHLVIESLPIVLQFALFLFGCAMSTYLWTISRTVAGVTLTITLFGIISYTFLTIAATPHYNCPYQTPPSILIRTLIKYVTHSNSTFALSIRSGITSLAGAKPHLAKKLRETSRYLSSAVLSLFQNFGYIPGTPNDADIQLVEVVPFNTPFKEVPIDWEACRGDARCVSWVLDTTTDIDVIFSAARFAADMIWYPEIAHTLSPHTLADLFHECLSDGRIIPDRLEHASAIGMAFASVLSIQLCMEPKRRDLDDLVYDTFLCVDDAADFEPKRLPGVEILRIVTDAIELVDAGSFRNWRIFSVISDNLSIANKQCLSRMVLQTVWRWRRVQRPAAVVFNLEGIDVFCKRLMANGGHAFSALGINCFIIMTISLGAHVANIRYLHPPRTKWVVLTRFIRSLLIVWQGSVGYDGPRFQQSTRGIYRG